MKIKPFKFFFLCFFMIGISLSGAYAQREGFKKANRLYKLREYAAAIPIYETALQSKDKASARFKLAYCYRMLNQMAKAEVVYASLIGEKKIKPITYFYYGEALMSNGKYDEAKLWFKEFQKQKPGDKRGAQMAKACDEVRYIEPYFPDIKISSFNQNSLVDDTAPVFFNNGIIFSSDRKAGISLLKQKSRWTGREYIKLYFSKQLEDGSFSKAKTYSRKLNALNKNTSCISITADKKEVFFTRNSMRASKNDVYNMQLYSAKSTNGKRWKNVELLPFSSNELNYMHPAISPDGKSLFFISDNKKGHGGTDIYVVHRTKKGWSRPQNLGATINTASNEGFPFIHQDGRLFFCSKGHAGYGGFDIFFSKQDEEGNWSAPINLGKPINSSFDDITIFLKEDAQSGLFTSSREGGDDDIYLFELLEEGKGIILEIEGVESMEKLSSAKTPKEEVMVLVSEESVKKQAIDSVKTSKIKMIDENQFEIANDNNSFGEEAMVETKLEVVAVSNAEEATDKIANHAPSSSEATDKIISKEELVWNKPVEINTKQDSLKEEITPLVIAEEMDSNAVVIEETSLQASEKTIEDKLEIEDTKTNVYEEWYQLISIKPLTEANTIQINGIDFEKGAYKIDASIAENLNILVEFLNRHPELEIEIGGHTWSLGDDKENWEISKKRSRAIVAYLMRHGVYNKRLSFKAYGETNLLNHCTNEVACKLAEHAINERLEMKVIRFKAQ